MTRNRMQNTTELCEAAPRNLNSHPKKPATLCTIAFGKRTQNAANARSDLPTDQLYLINLLTDQLVILSTA